MKKNKTKFNDYIRLIKNDLEKGDTYLFLRFDIGDLHLIKSIQGKKVFTLEISQNRWEEVEWDKDDEDEIYPITIFEIVELFRQQ